jgi:hypothetical protein
MSAVGPEPRIGELWNPANPVSALILKQTQADAGSTALFDEPKPHARGFGLMDDIFDRIDRRSEECDRMAAIRRDGLLESYVKGRASAECVVVVNGSPRKWKFVFRTVVDRIKSRQLADGSRAVADCDVRAAHCDRDELGVCRVAELVQGPEFAVPSLVRLEPDEEGDNRIGDILADFSPGYQVFEVIERVGDGELSPLQTGVS